MFGYYDPKSLKIDGDRKSAHIDFIDCADATNVRRIEIKTPEKARRIAQALEAQAKNHISNLDGDVVELRGSIAFNEKHPDEAIMECATEPKRTIALKTNFFLSPGQLPRFAGAIVRGIEHDGAFIAHMLVVKPAMPGFEPRASIFDRSANGH